jgi:hypothetical protein
MVRYGLQQSRACFVLSANHLGSMPRPWLVHSVVSSVGTDIDLFSFLGILAFGVPCACA